MTSIECILNQVSLNIHESTVAKSVEIIHSPDDGRVVGLLLKTRDGFRITGNGGTNIYLPNLEMMLLKDQENYRIGFKEIKK
jgi:hypothetical protein